MVKNRSAIYSIGGELNMQRWACAVLGALCGTAVRTASEILLPQTTLKTVPQVGTARPYPEPQVKLLFNTMEPQLKFEICKLASNAVPQTAQNFGYYAYLCSYETMSAIHSM